MSNEDIDDLLSQLNRLRIAETSIIERIVAARQANPTNSRQPTVEDDVLQIGDAVTILNPRKFQENTGIICNISEKRVTIKPKKGIKIVRHPKNIIKTPNKTEDE
jgi:hypothetical protein